jgi:hypothetical protein
LLPCASTGTGCAASVAARASATAVERTSSAANGAALAAPPAAAAAPATGPPRTVALATCTLPSGRRTSTTTDSVEPKSACATL